MPQLLTSVRAVTPSSSPLARSVAPSDSSGSLARSVAPKPQLAARWRDQPRQATASAPRRPAAPLARPIAPSPDTWRDRASRRHQGARCGAVCAPGSRLPYTDGCCIAPNPASRRDQSRPASHAEVLYRAQPRQLARSVAPEPRTPKCCIAPNPASWRDQSRPAPHAEVLYRAQPRQLAPSVAPSPSRRSAVSRQTPPVGAISRGLPHTFRNGPGPPPARQRPPANGTGR